MILRSYTFEEANYFHGVVYLLVSPSNKCYIGQTTNVTKRHNRYKNNSVKKQPKIYNAIAKYGFSNFQFKIIDIAETQEELNRKETYYIELYNCIDNGYNLKTGGNENSSFSEITKEKMSLAKKNKYNGINNPFYGKKHSEETITIIRNKNKEYAKNNKNHFYGKKHNIESKLLIAAAQLGRKHTKEHITKCSKHGKENVFSKRYVFISPQNTEYIVEGEFQKFVKNNKLSLTTCKLFINKGKIPKPINENHNRMTIERLNTTGWSITQI